MFRADRSGYSCQIAPSEDGSHIVWIHDGQPTQRNVEEMFGAVAALPFYRPDIDCIDIWADTMDPSRMDPEVVTRIGLMVGDILKRNLAAKPPTCAVLDLMQAKSGFGSFYTAFISEVAKANLVLSVSQDMDGIARSTGRTLDEVSALVTGSLDSYYAEGTGKDPTAADAVREALSRIGSGAPIGRLADNGGGGRPATDQIPIPRSRFNRT